MPSRPPKGAMQRPLKVPPTRDEYPVNGTTGCRKCGVLVPLTPSGNLLTCMFCGHAERRA